MLPVSEKVAQIAEHFARHDSHGYSQPNRGSGSIETITLSDGSRVKVRSSDVDCSEMVRECVNGALSGTCGGPIAYMWTGNEDEELTSHGFERTSYSASKVRRGDVLLVSGHTGVALGDGLQADAHGDEYGGITGPNRGDQTGHEVEVRALRSWTYIYRYAGGGPIDGEAFPVRRTVVFDKRTYVRSQPSADSSAIVKSNGKSVKYERGDSVTIDGMDVVDGFAWGTYVGGSGQRRWVAIGKSDRVKK